MEKLWMGLLVMVPVLPKVEVVSWGGVPLLLDDCALLCALLLAGWMLVTQAAVSGRLRLSVSRVVPLFSMLILYKSVDLGILSLIHPWTDRFGIGKGVLLAEGTLVLAKTLAFFLIYLLLLTYLRSRESIYTLVRYQIWCIAVVVGIGLIQFFVLDHPILTSTFRNIHHLTENAEIWKVKDPWLDPGAAGHEHLGAYMVLSLSLLGGLLLCKWPLVQGWRRLVALLWVGCLFNLVFSSSRGAWVAGACALGMLSWFALRRGRAKVLILWACLIIGVALLLQVAGYADVAGYMENRVVGVTGALAGKVGDDSTLQRLSLLRTLWEVFSAHPVFGMGPGGAGRIAEGQFIRELVEGGAIGMALFLALMVQSGRLALKLYRSTAEPMTQGIGMGFCCCLIGLGGQAFFTELLVLTKISVPFWMLAAVAHRLGRVAP